MRSLLCSKRDRTPEFIKKCAKLDGSYCLRCSWNSEKSEACAVIEGRLCQASVMVNKNPAGGNKIRGVVVECLLFSGSIGRSSSLSTYFSNVM